MIVLQKVRQDDETDVRYLPDGESETADLLMDQGWELFAMLRIEGTPDATEDAESDDTPKRSTRGRKRAE